MTQKKRTRTIGGKRYELYSVVAYRSQKDAREVAEEIRMCGYNVRVLPGMDVYGNKGWMVWRRRMG